jgi:TRAP-type C4-dicarboxylate transport system permease large subunit
VLAIFGHHPRARDRPVHADAGRGVGVFAVLAYGLRCACAAKGLTLEGIRQALLDAAVTSGMIYFILFGAEVLKGFFTRAGLPAALADWAGTSGLDPWVALIAMLAMLIVLGCFMESLSMILVVVPFFWPALIDLNGGDGVTAAMRPTAWTPSS